MQHAGGIWGAGAVALAGAGLLGLRWPALALTRALQHAIARGAREDERIAAELSMYESYMVKRAFAGDERRAASGQWK
jgi:hypothetical protein